MADRTPAELPDEHQLYDIYAGQERYRSIEDPQFNAFFSSREFPEKDFLDIEDNPDNP